jgi:hypothetical protein
MTFDAYGGDDVTAVLAAYHAPLVYALPHLIKLLVHTKLQLDTVRVLRICTIANPQSYAYTKAWGDPCQWLIKGQVAVKR